MDDGRFVAAINTINVFSCTGSRGSSIVLMALETTSRPQSERACWQRALALGTPSSAEPPSPAPWRTSLTTTPERGHNTYVAFPFWDTRRRSQESFALEEDNMLSYPQGITSIDQVAVVVQSLD